MKYLVLVRPGTSIYVSIKNPNSKGTRDTHINGYRPYLFIYFATVFKTYDFIFLLEMYLKSSALETLKSRREVRIIPFSHLFCS